MRLKSGVFKSPLLFRNMPVWRNRNRGVKCKFKFNSTGFFQFYDIWRHKGCPSTSFLSAKKLASSGLYHQFMLDIVIILISEKISKETTHKNINLPHSGFIRSPRQIWLDLSEIIRFERDFKIPKNWFALRHWFAESHQVRLFQLWKKRDSWNFPVVWTYFRIKILRLFYYFTTWKVDIKECFHFHWENIRISN